MKTARKLSINELHRKMSELQDLLAFQASLLRVTMEQVRRLTLHTGLEAPEQPSATPPSKL